MKRNKMTFNILKETILLTLKEMQMNSILNILEIPQVTNNRTYL